MTGDTVHHLSYLQDAIQTTLDPAHITAEVIFTLITDVLLGLILIPSIKRAIRRHDSKEHQKP